MTRTRRYLFTSESVTEGHPDKIADQISDSVLDAILAQDPLARVACETLVTTGLAIIAGEITTKCTFDFQKVVRDTITEVGYTRGKYGFDADTCAVLSSIHGQSPDIAMGVDPGGAGDQGLMFGYACTESDELMPLPIAVPRPSSTPSSSDPKYTFQRSSSTSSRPTSSPAGQLLRYHCVPRNEITPLGYARSTRKCVGYASGGS